jgi:hypothetical protein
VKNRKLVVTSDIASAILSTMAYQSSIQVIERANRTRQYYLICPAPLAQALEMEKGETIQWIVEDKYTLTIRRTPAPSPTRGRGGKS